MRSQLTRRVFRRLLSNEGYSFQCPQRAYHLASVRHRRNAFPAVSAARHDISQRRAIFGFSRKLPKEPKEQELEPGFQKMIDLSLRETIHARPPTNFELKKALAQFFSYKAKAGSAVNNLQAEHALRTLQYMKSQGSEINEYTLKTALQAMTVIPKDETDFFLGLAKALFNEISDLGKIRGKILAAAKFTTILSGLGRSNEARTLYEDIWRNPIDDPFSTMAEPEVILVWSNILSGFARENNEVELLKTLQIMDELKVDYTASALEAITTFYASKDQVEQAKTWYNKVTGYSDGPSPAMLKEMLHFCSRNNEQEFCKNMFRDVLEAKPSKGSWDITFQWAAGTLGKGVEDVERMMGIMESRYPDDPSMRPDIDTINGLVELAMSKDDSYLAERYVALGKKFAIRPNARTFILQMDYRVRAGDLSGAEASYKALQAEEIVKDEDLPVINKYIRALCSFESVPYDRIVSIKTDLDERNARLEADTTSALCMVHLQRHEIDEVMDIVSVNTYHYTIAERARIRDAFLDFVLDRKNSDWRAWEAYSIIIQMFDETSVSIRTRIMNEFFARKRSDMACHVFGHMRQHIAPDRRPVRDTYIDCFVGIASCADGESLDMVHNMFKMDSSVEPNTRLYNSLMLAYTACDDAPRSLHFWDDITNSREGPSYKSLEIVFQACQRTPFGDKPARDIWNKMIRMEIEITREVHAAYAGALAGQGKLDEVKAVVESMEKDVGFGPDYLTIGTIYNAIQGSNRKELVEEWCKEVYPKVWNEIEKFEMYEHEEGHMVIKMPERELKA